MDTVLFAKAYTKKGWDVFPLRPREKTPAVKWADVATHEENMAVGWFETQPDANIGIACGKRSGIVVLDVDAGHGGYDSLADLTIEYGPLPTTPTAETGGGGEHIFFKHPGVEIRNSAGKLAPGLDIRGDGGYVVAAPSVHPSGKRYAWRVKPSETPLADMPAWMIEKLKEPPVHAPSVSGKIINGSRNSTLASLAGSMRRRGFDEEAIFAALQSHNSAYCDPPLPDGEVRKIAQSIKRYEPTAPVVKEAPQMTDPFTVIDILENEIRERELDPKEVWGIPYAWPYISKITGGKQKGELIYIGGEPGVGKSWFAHQDMMHSAIYNNVPSLIWSGEMPQKQVFRRMFEMLGVPKRAMLTGQNMANYWQTFNEAKALIVNSPLYVCDQPLDLDNVEEFLEREIKEHGIQQALFDYDWLIGAKGQSEIETSQNISRAFKGLARKLDISIILISSVNKGGMDTTAETTKSNLSGSGKKIHDADIVYLITKLNESKVPQSIMEQFQPKDYWRIVTLNISKGRDLDYFLPDKKLLYVRDTPNPKFTELSKETK